MKIRYKNKGIIALFFLGIVMIVNANETRAQESKALTGEKADTKSCPTPTTTVDNKESLKVAIEELIKQGSTADLNSIDTSRITDMSELFVDMENFNGDISCWDVSNVTDMSSMFSGAKEFNHEIGGWDVSHVTDMSRMFEEANAF